VAAHQPEAPGCLDLPPLATPNDARNRVNEAMNPTSRGFLLKRTCATALAMLAGMMRVKVPVRTYVMAALIMGLASWRIL
jgi:hypothetical protein